MARQGIFTGSSPNDGTGDSLASGAVKVNQNFTEIYSTFGDGNNLVSYVNNAGVATVAGNLTGSPNLNVGVVTATSFYGDGSNLTGVGGTFVGPASTITSGEISNWNAAYGWGDHSLVGYSTFSGNYNDLSSKPTIPVNLTDLSDVNAGTPSTGQVLKWSGSEWQAASDLTAAGGSGIGLTDLSVTIEPAGINSLTYNNTTGVFEFTPTDLSSYLTNVNITAGSNITVLETSEGNFIITATGGSVGSAGTWAVNASGIHTTKNVGINTTLSSSALWVEGDGYFSGVVTATRFESDSAGTPTIDSPNNLNINAVTVAISTDLTVGGDTYVGIDTSSGLVLSSPNGTQYRLIVDNSGNLSTVLVP